MKGTLVFFAVLLIALGAFAQNASELNSTHMLPTKGWARPGGGGSGQNLTYLGGPVLVSAKVVMIFWGPSFSGSDASYAQTLQSFRSQFGTNPEFNVITQYYQTTNGSTEFIQLSNLAGGTADMFDSSAPPTNVTDSAVQQEVLKYLSQTGHTYDASTIYEVFIPSTSYSSNGTSDSCGGPNLVYCAYHGHFSNGGRDIKYSIQPYPSCSGCTVSGWTAVQNQEHFVCHETREAVTDPDLNAWGDHRGNEADDKCAWSPTPFIDGGYGYQYEWSNSAGGCVQKQ